MTKAMIIKRVLFSLLIISYGVCISQTQLRRNVYFPDIPGYKTLKCDFHSHTFLSDGNVSPEYRVNEAWTDGLDVVAITDHIDERPKVKFDKKGKIELYRLAYAAAKKTGIVLIPGGELTKLRPVGHYNMLFIHAFCSVKRGCYFNVLKRAKAQSAFIIWNHPGWSRYNKVSRWYKVQSKIYHNGLMNGIEIVNGTKTYPAAFQWALEKGLTIFGNSDIHDSTKNAYREINGEHRPMTLVFSKDTSLQLIKESLLAKRTVVYEGNRLYGDEKYLIPLFNASIEMMDADIILHKSLPSDSTVLYITNHSCIDYKLKLAGEITGLTFPIELTLKAYSENMFTVKSNDEALVSDDDYKCIYTIENLFKSPAENIQIKIPVHIRIL